MTDSTIRKSIFLATDADTLWGFLTEPEKMARWFHPATAPLEQGGEFTLVSQKDGERMCWGRVLEMERPARMVWDFTVGPLDGEMTRVEWQIVPDRGGVRLDLEHAGLPQTQAAFGLLLALDKGWHGFLQGLYSL